MSPEAASETVPGFLARYVFALFPEGGIALDLGSGTYSTLNATAAGICGLIARGKSWDDTLADARRRWNLTAEEASAAIAGVTRALATSRQAPALDEPMPYLPAGTGYALHHRGRPVLSVTSDGNHLSCLARPADLPLPIEHYLRVLSPKIAAAHGILVLHAAACLVRGHLVAFCGRSGAGKTTTTGLLAELGAEKVADDLLVVTLGNGVAVGHPDAEARMYSWCAGAAAALADRPGEPLPCRGLVEAATGPVVPLARLVFLDAASRGAEDFVTDPLLPLQSLELVLWTAFLGSLEPGRLRRFLTACQALSEAVPAERARVPLGLPALRLGLERYMTKTAS